MMHCGRHAKAVRDDDRVASRRRTLLRIAAGIIAAGVFQADAIERRLRSRSQACLRVRPAMLHHHFGDLFADPG